MAKHERGHRAIEERLRSGLRSVANQEPDGDWQDVTDRAASMFSPLAIHRHTRRRRLATVAAAAIVLIAVAGVAAVWPGGSNEQGRVRPAAEIASSDTTGSAGSGSATAPPVVLGNDLATLVKAAQPTTCCTDTSADQATFTLDEGLAVRLVRTPITTHAPEDPRRDLVGASYVTLRGGGVALTGGRGGDVVVRFDCANDRYELRSAAGHVPALLTFAPVLSARAGCDRMSVSAPTECLGGPLDGGPCSESDGG